MSSNFLDEPLGDEVPHNPTSIPTPHITSQPLTNSQHKRQLRSQDARQRDRPEESNDEPRPEECIYRGWLSHFPDPQPYGGKGSSRRLRNPKPSYGPTPQAPSQGDRQPRNSCSHTSKKFPIWKCHKFRRRMQVFLKLKKHSSHNRFTPNHMRHHHNTTSTPHQLTSTTTHITDSCNTNCPQGQSSNCSSNKERSTACHSTNCPQSQSSSSCREQWKQQHDMATRLHTRANWLKEHIQQPSHKGRVKHDLQVPHHSTLKGGVWNTTGLLEAGKMHSIAALMKTHEVDWLALTETHMKRQDRASVSGYGPVPHTGGDRPHAHAQKASFLYAGRRGSSTHGLRRVRPTQPTRTRST